MRSTRCVGRRTSRRGRRRCTHSESSKAYQSCSIASRRIWAGAPSLKSSARHHRACPATPHFAAWPGLASLLLSISTLAYPRRKVEGGNGNGKHEKQHVASDPPFATEQAEEQYRSTTVTSLRLPVPGREHHRHCESRYHNTQQEMHVNMSDATHTCKVAMPRRAAPCRTGCGRAELVVLCRFRRRHEARSLTKRW